MKLPLGGLLLAVAFGQAQPSLEFDAAALKIDTSSDQPSGQFQNGRLIIHNMSLRSFIAAAYHVPNDSIVGPDWVDSVHFDLSAKTGATTSDDDSRLMLRKLLEQQLKLKVHTEKKNDEVYALKVAKKGPKLTESKPGSAAQPGCPSYHPIRCFNVTVQSLSSVLPQVAGTTLNLPVRDMTGLAGHYDFELSLEPDPDGRRPSVFDALEDQLGLKLEIVKRSFDAIAVDHVERTPIEN